MGKIEKIQPSGIFTNYIFKSIPLAFDESLSYYEMLCGVLDLLKTQEEVINNNADLLAELEQYVIHYFDNLDVQEEINNKLDEMAEDGTLENIISEYIQLQTTYTYNTISDMKQATNLINGSFVRTCGFYQYNDGGGATYKVRTLINTDIVDEILLFALNDEELVAELVIKNEINVKQLGINGEDVDNKEILLKAIQNFHTINYDEDIELDDTLELENISNKIINGNNHKIFITHEKSKNLITLDGCNNITFNNVQLTNDEIRTGSQAPAHLFLLWGIDSEYLSFKGCKFYNPYHDCVMVRQCGNLLFDECIFKDVYYNGLTLLEEVHDVMVDKCLFDTTHTTYENAYLFATGSFDYETEWQYLVKNITVQNSKFLNNPQWEGLETHGGENISFINNYIYNCLEGIHYGYDERPTVVNQLVDNVIIKNNIIINDLLENTRRGIMVGGSTNKYGSNYIVSDNIVIGYGGKIDNVNYSGIEIYYCKNGVISNNQIRKFKNRGISLPYCYNIEVIGNTVCEPNDDTSVGVYTNANWLCIFNNNQIYGSNEHKIVNGISTSNNKGYNIYIRNLIFNYTMNKYRTGTNNSTILGTVTNSTAKRLGVKGVWSVDDNDIPKSYCTDTVIRGVAGTSGMTVTGIAGSNKLSCNATLSNICPYQEIVIEGAGEGGADLTTEITDVISQTEITIKDEILTSITNATVSTTASTWSNF